MQPTLEEVKKDCPELEPTLVQEHFSRLNPRYFETFSRSHIAAHLRAISRLRPEHLLEVLVSETENNLVECTVIGFDYPGLFSLITGVLAAMGFNIDSGDVFTYQHLRQPQRADPRRRRQPRLARVPFDKRRRIIDRFAGTVATSLTLESWAAEVEKKLSDIVRLLESGDSNSALEARHRVNEMVVKRLAQYQTAEQPVLYPVQIRVDNSATDCTRLLIYSEDTPAFLYSLSTALSLHGVSIEHVRIRTISGRIEDEIDIVDASGRKLENPEHVNQIKFSVLLTKQFTYFLSRAPDPYAALCRFENLVKDVARRHDPQEWLALLSNPHTLQDLARLLGTSDYLWEDFIRLHYETLVPMLGPIVEGRRFSEPLETLPARLQEALGDAATVAEQTQRLNDFKDREIFLIDLDHILNAQVDFHELSRRLTVLAEQVVSTAASLSYEHLRARYGAPRSAAGLEAKFAILGLGKLGGASLGYASDIEFLVVYSDNGWTDGQKSIANSEFFELLVKQTAQFIRAKREGIFHVDLRLRPHGSAGPLACSLENFCRYYGPGSTSHSYERLALVRLRCIGGDAQFGAQIERLRDEFVYASANIDLQELRQLRKKQFEEKTAGGRLNAKFSPGGLVDLEYNVQILQVIHGKDLPQLRTPLLRQALLALTDTGVLTAEEGDRLLSAYDFLRQLINCLRMLRGSARDLFLPAQDSVECAALANRMGYRRGAALEPAQQLYLDLEAHMAAVRAFAEHFFGREALPAPATGSVADLILSADTPEPLQRAVLTSAGFKNWRRAYLNLRSLAGSGSRRDIFAKLALLATDVLQRTPDADMALNNWERYILALPSPEFHYNLLLSQPMRLEILLTILAGSQFLADTLIRNPGFLDWIIIPENLHHMRKRQDLQEELEEAGRSHSTHAAWLNHLRRFRRREILRIGTRDMYLGTAVEDVTAELSTLAEAVTEAVLQRIWATPEPEKKTGADLAVLADHFCFVAFGKLGGNELNYSSDIDLLGIFDVPESVAAELGLEPAVLKYLFTWIVERTALDLSRHTEEGYAYRVDLRLRPYGRAGELAQSLAALVDYYRQSASLWEIQAALKIRPVAGNLQIGERFLEQLQPILRQRRRARDIVESIEKMRSAAARKTILSGGTDVKSGVGGLRDVEFLVQGLQLVHAPDFPQLIEGNTLKALAVLQQHQLLPERAAAELRQDYLFLRRVEHCLQILEDRQIHMLPRDEAELTALARRVLGMDATAATLLAELEACQSRVRSHYATLLVEGKGGE
ncbi:MAG: glutamate-ammonia-ligase adenylyltransferase [Deltaproteobacteria bacterium]|nr:glutamate-ammonia-ligase adenylyltransferase [Deltaproteobacteria bacterium]MBW2070524.1 glutamate-ammonia-ligase adenylyltransferase [Deltaproteobacteria bacterium]